MNMFWRIVAVVVLATSSGYIGAWVCEHSTDHQEQHIQKIEERYR